MSRSLAKELFLGPWRPATKEEVVRSLSAPAMKQAVNPSRIRESHHYIFMLAARGFTDKEISAVTGYGPNRVSQLRNCPAGEDMIAKYMARGLDHLEKTLDERQAVAIRINNLAGLQMLDQLVEADETGDRLPFAQLLKAWDSSHDRVGIPRKSTNINVNANFARQLEEAIARGEELKLVAGSEEAT